MKSGPDVKALDDTVDTLAGNPPFPSNTVWQEIKEIFSAIRRNDDTSHAFLLRVVQPGTGGSDGWIGLNTGPNLRYCLLHPYIVRGFPGRYSICNGSRY